MSVADAARSTSISGSRRPKTAASARTSRSRTQSSSACGNDADFGLPRPGLSMDLRDERPRRSAGSIGWKPGDRVELELDDGRRLPARIVDGWVLREFPERDDADPDPAAPRRGDRRHPGDAAAAEPPVDAGAGRVPRVCWRSRRSRARPPCCRSRPRPPGKECYRVSTGSSESATLRRPAERRHRGQRRPRTARSCSARCRCPPTSLEVVFEDGERADVPLQGGVLPLRRAGGAREARPRCRRSSSRATRRQGASRAAQPRRAASAAR